MWNATGKKTLGFKKKEKKKKRKNDPCVCTAAKQLNVPLTHPNRKREEWTLAIPSAYVMPAWLRSPATRVQAEEPGFVPSTLFPASFTW